MSGLSIVEEDLLSGPTATQSPMSDHASGLSIVEEDLLSGPTATQSPMSDHAVFHRSFALSSPCNVGKRKD